MASESHEWVTAITDVRPDEVLVRGFALSELVGRISFTDAVHLVTIGEMPTASQRAMLDALMVSLIDHGISPSSMVARQLASCGIPLQAAIAGGALSIGDWHGGAGEQTAKTLGELVSRANESSLDAEIAHHVEAMNVLGVRFEGFGHPQHRDGDPRAIQLLDLARELGIAGAHVNALKLLGEEIGKTKSRPLMANINGALAAILLDLGYPWRCVRGFVIAARTMGLTAHVIEEVETDQRWRHAAAESIRYTGPLERHLPSSR